MPYLRFTPVPYLYISTCSVPILDSYMLHVLHNEDGSGFVFNSLFTGLTLHRVPRFTVQDEFLDLAGAERLVIDLETRQAPVQLGSVEKPGCF